MFCCSSLKFLTNEISHQQKHPFGQCGDKRQFLDVAQSFCSVIHFLGKVILKVLRRFYSFKDKCDVLSWSFIEVTGMVLVSPYPKWSCAQCLNPQGPQFLVFYLEKQKPAIPHLGQHNWLKGKFQRFYKKAPRLISQFRMVARYMINVQSQLYLFLHSLNNWKETFSQILLSPSVPSIWRHGSNHLHKSRHVSGSPCSFTLCF